LQKDCIFVVNLGDFGNFGRFHIDSILVHGIPPLPWIVLELYQVRSVCINVHFFLTF
jgi:hypothetical protein